MIKINLENNILILTYFPESPWVLDKLGLDGEATLKKTFTFSSGDLVSSSDQEEESGIKFILGSRVGDYFKIESRILDIRHNIFFHKNMNFSEKFFIAYKSTSIFKNIDRLVSEDLYIGGDLPGSFPETEFTCLIKEFPNGYEIQKYVDARLGAVLSNYFESTSNLEEKYNLYMNKRKSIKGLNLPKTFRTEEVAKYKTILEKLETMLEAEDSYNEKRWQEEITQIILLLYQHKYLCLREKQTVLQLITLHHQTE